MMLQAPALTQLDQGTPKVGCVSHLAYQYMCMLTGGNNPAIASTMQIQLHPGFQHKASCNQHGCVSELATSTTGQDHAVAQ